MSRVRGSGNKTTELKMVVLLRAAKIRGWRRNSRLYGRPDFIFLKHQLAVFIDGCFWHRCPKNCKPPPDKNSFWTQKLEHNRLRDSRTNRVLRRKGWQVVRIWEHELTAGVKCLRPITRALGRAVTETSSVVAFRNRTEPRTARKAKGSL
jgi:DNA mismatch endonuclease (patch repair protein)